MKAAVEGVWGTGLVTAVAAEAAAAAAAAVVAVAVVWVGKLTGAAAEA
jgi:hypothetical protein